MRSSNIFSVALAAAAIVVAGCASGPIPEDQRVGQIRSIVPASESPKEVRVEHGFTFVVLGGQGFMGDMKYTVLDGLYVLHGEDEIGRYYRHKERGIVRSGNLGIADSGGFFVPKDRVSRWGVWMIPHGNDVAIGLFDPAGAGLSTADRRTNVVYLANIPIDEAVRLAKNEAL